MRMPNLIISWQSYGVLEIGKRKYSAVAECTGVYPSRGVLEKAKEEKEIGRDEEGKD